MMSKVNVCLVVGVLLSVVLLSLNTPVDEASEGVKTLEELKAFWMFGNGDQRQMTSECRSIREELLDGMRDAFAHDEMGRVLASVALRMDRLFSEQTGSALTRFAIVDGSVRDEWKHPLNVARVDAVKDHANLVRTAIDCIVIWSSGKNGVNEYGEGDDIVFPPRRRSLTDNAR